MQSKEGEERERERERTNFNESEVTEVGFEEVVDDVSDFELERTRKKKKRGEEKRASGREGRDGFFWSGGE